MPKPTIVPRRGIVPASALLEAVGNDLTSIKSTDGLTDVDLGAALGVCDDQAGKYRSGLATMSLVTFLRGCQTWNGRFANGALGMLGMKLVDLESTSETDRSTLTTLTRLLLEMSVALEDDGLIDDAELKAMKTSLEEAGRSIDRLRQRLSVRAA
jgi:hypothetical protein